MPLYAEIANGQVEVDGHPAFPGTPSCGKIGIGLTPYGTFTGGIMPQWNDLPGHSLSDGEHHWKTVDEVTVFDGTSNKAPVLARFFASVSGTSIVVPTSQTVVTPIHDEKLRAAVEKSIKVHEVKIWDTISGRTSIMFNVASPPAPLSFDVWARAEGREWHMGAVCFGRGGGVAGSDVEGKLDGLRGDRIDVILRPSAQALLATYDMNQYWDGEMVFKDVPVVRSQTAKKEPMAIAPPMAASAAAPQPAKLVFEAWQLIARDQATLPSMSQDDVLARAEICDQLYLVGRELSPDDRTIAHNHIAIRGHGRGKVSNSKSTDSRHPFGGCHP